MTTAYTSLLGLALPVTGELSGTWGDTVNNGITSLLDSAIAGTTTLSTDADVTLTTTTGAANTAREAILLWTAGGTATRTITVPAQSKIYTVINKTSSTQSIKVVGAGPTTGVTIIAGETAQIAWNGSDFVKIGELGGDVSFRNVTITGTTTLSGGTANGVAYLNGSKVVTTGSALTWDGSTFGVSGLATIALQSTSGFAAIRGYTAGSGNLVLQDNVGAGIAWWISAKTAGILAIGGNGGTEPSGVINISSAGNVGIGTTSPSAKLHVAGSTFRHNDATGSYGYTISAATNTTTLATLFGGSSFAIQTAASGTNQLLLDASGNLGLGVTPSAWSGGTIELPSDGALAFHGPNGNIGANYYYNSGFKYTTTAAASLYSQVTGQHRWFNAPSGTAGNAITFTQAMTLDASGNLGIGTTSPAAKLNVTSNATVSTSAYYSSTFSSLINAASSSGISALGLTSLNSGGFPATASFHVVPVAGYRSGLVATYAADSGGSGYFAINQFDPNASTTYERLRLDVNGNLGLGVTPSAWGSSEKAIQVNNQGAFWSINSSNPNVWVSANTYFDNTNFRYINTAVATTYQQTNGQHLFYTAPSGTAGNAITFTQAMTLQASGGLSVGTTSDPGANNIGLAAGGKLYYSTNAWITPEDNSIGARVSGTSVVGFWTGGSEAARIDASGNLGLGVTPSAWSGGGLKAIEIAASGNNITANNVSTYINANAYYNGAWKYGYTGSATQYLLNAGQHTWYTAPSGTAGNTITFTQAMTLDASGRLLVGLTSGTSGYNIEAQNGSSGTGLRVSNTSGGYATFEISSNATSVATLNFTNSLSLMGGNVGIGTGTPKAQCEVYGDSQLTANLTDAGLRGGQLRLAGSSAAYGSGGAITFANQQGDAANSVGFAAIKGLLYDGSNNTSGAICFSVRNVSTDTALTEAARFESSGNFMVGTTSPLTANAHVSITPGVSNGTALVVQSNNGVYGSHFGNTSGTAIYYPCVFANNGFSSTVGSISVAASSTAYNTSSDYRLKNITGPITNSGAYIDRLNPVEGTWKADGSTFVGLIAHEVQEASRTPVATGVKDGEEMQGMDYSSAEIIANLIAEIQSLRKRLAAAGI